MSELRLFSIEGGKAQECHAAFYKLEREVQNLFEANLEALLGVRFVASEFSTGQGGRIDTLGLDENNFPVVIEYKLDKNKTVINQGMSYMAWLRSHKSDFWRAVESRLGREVADRIDHSSTRLICVATDFTRDDLGAYELMPNNIDLVRYRRFGENQLLLERIQSNEAPVATSVSSTSSVSKGATVKPIAQVLDEMEPKPKAVYEELRQAILTQGEDVVESPTKVYIAYKRTRNFASIAANKSELLLYLHLDPSKVELAEGMRDMRGINHFGTGNLEIRVSRSEDVARAMPLIQQAYEGQS